MIESCPICDSKLILVSGWHMCERCKQYEWADYGGGEINQFIDVGDMTLEYLKDEGRCIIMECGLKIEEFKMSQLTPALAKEWAKRLKLYGVFR